MVRGGGSQKGGVKLTKRRLRTLLAAIDHAIFHPPPEIRGTPKRRYVRELFEAQDWVKQELARRDVIVRRKKPRQDPSALGHE